MKLEDDGRHNDENSRWAWLAVRSQEVFYQAVESYELESFFKYYVSVFGKEGAEADLRWILAANPASLVGREREPIRGHGKTAKYPRAQLGIAEALVPRLLKEPAIRQRYWEANLYARCFLRASGDGSLLGISIATVHAGFEKGKKEDYWYYARIFVMLAHATHWDEPLRGYRPDDLVAAFHVWRKWYEENEEYMVADQEQHRWRLDEQAKAKGSKTNKHDELPALKELTYPFSDWGKPESTSSSNSSASPRVWPNPPTDQLMRFERQE
jgi:hypothetical protein